MAMALGSSALSLEIWCVWGVEEPQSPPHIVHPDAGTRKAPRFARPWEAAPVQGPETAGAWKPKLLCSASLEPTFADPRSTLGVTTSTMRCVHSYIYVVYIRVHAFAVLRVWTIPKPTEQQNPVNPSQGSVANFARPSTTRAERGVVMQSPRAVALEPFCFGEYRSSSM